MEREFKKDTHAAWALGMDAKRVRCVLASVSLCTCAIIFSFLTNLSARLQLTETLEKDMFMHEAHIHTLANMNDTKVLVVQEEAVGRVRTTLYSPGWAPQVSVTRQAVKDLMQSDAPPIVLNLNKANTHFSAYARDGDGVSSGASAAIPMDLDPD
jgi:hypothetical protein